MTLTFEVPGKPQGKQRARVCVRGGYARAYTPDDTASYENLIKLCFKAACGTHPIERGIPIKMHIKAFYEIPKSFSKKKTDEAVRGLVNPLTKPDVDNIAKIVCDALNGIAYIDDSQIIMITAQKEYSLIPKIVVSIMQN